MTNGEMVTTVLDDLADDEPAVVTTDGRTARATRTRTGIVDALLSLLDEGEAVPTAGRIAERAGISARLIFHHFGDLESLFAAVAERQDEHIKAITRPIDPALPLDARVDALLDERTAILDLLTPVRRAVLVHEPYSATIRAAQRQLRARSRAKIEQTFAPELARVPAGRRVVLGDALQGALSWGLWNDLLVDGLSRDAARSALRAVLTALLDPYRG